MDNNNNWVVEWSQSQACFHVEEMEKTLDRNRQAYHAGRSSDYQILAIVKDQDDAHRTITELRSVREAAK
jgi:hypothetical protein